MISYNNAAPKAVNNVGQFGATEGSIGAYKSAAEYAADAKYWALLSQTRYASVEEVLAEVERLYAQGYLLEEDIKQLKKDFEAQEQVLIGLIQSTGTAIDNTNAATELSKEATQNVLAQLDIISNMTVQTTLLPPGSLATGSYDNLTGEFSFGIPEGKPGRDGTDGTISDIGSVPVGTPVIDDYGFYVDKIDGGLYRADMSDIANLVPSVRSISINGGAEQTGTVSFNSVSSFNTRTGDVVSQAGDYEVSQIIGAAASGDNSDITSLSGLTTAISVSQGGTGATSAEDARVNLGLGSVSVENIIPLTKGGTGATTSAGARSNLGLGLVSTESIVPITKGGTGSTSAENARLALVAAKSGANSDITSMTNSVTFTQPISIADGVSATNAVNLGQISSNQGASLIGTLEGVPVQNTISNINTDIIQLKLKWAIENGYSDAGFTFTTGGTLTVNDRYKVVYDPVSKTWYSYAGALPVVLPAGTDPASGEFVDVSHFVLRGSASVADFRLATDIDWGNAIVRALESNAAAIEFTPLPGGEKYEHANTITFSKDIKGSGVVRYTGTGNAYFASKKISIAQTQFESAGSDLSLWNITNSLGVTFCDNASVKGGLYNVVVNGPSSQFTFCGGATANYARADNIKIVQCKRSVIEYDTYIYGAAGWGVNIDSSTAALPNQMHGMVVLGQIWGNKAGGVRCVGRNTSGDKSDWIQHLIIGGHIDHNMDDDNPSTPSDGIYMRYVIRPILCADMLRSSARYGMNIDYVELPVISNKAYWKNTSGDFLIGSNVVRPMIMPYSGDYNGVNNVPNDTIEYGRSLRTFGNATIGGGKVDFGTLGWVRQFLSGGGQGNIEIDVNTDLPTRQVKVKNGTRGDVRFLVDGGIGANVFSGAPAGTITKKFAAYDANGNFVGEIPIYTN